MFTDNDLIDIDIFVENILNNKYNINYVNTNGENILHVISKNNRTDLLLKLLPLNPNLNFISADEMKNSPLHYASYNCHFDMIKLLIKNGADPNYKNIENSTPIFDICITGYDDILLYLIKSGADINIQDIYENTPLHLAINNNNLNIVKILISFGSDINVKNKKGLTPIFYAFIHNNTELILFLIMAGADIYATTKIGDTLLHYASEIYQNMEIIDKLIDMGLSPFIDNNYKKSCIDILKENNDYRVLFKIRHIVISNMNNIEHDIFYIGGIKNLIISYLM